MFKLSNGKAVSTSADKWCSFSVTGLLQSQEAGRLTESFQGDDIKKKKKDLIPLNLCRHMLRFSCSDGCGNARMPQLMAVIYEGVCLRGPSGWVPPVSAVLKHF